MFGPQEVSTSEDLRASNGEVQTTVDLVPARGERDYANFLVRLAVQRHFELGVRFLLALLCALRGSSLR